MVGPEVEFLLSWAGPVFQLPFALATLREGLAILRTKTAPASGLPFTSTFSNCLTWCTALPPIAAGATGRRLQLALPPTHIATPRV